MQQNAGKVPTESSISGQGGSGSGVGNCYGNSSGSDVGGVVTAIKAARVLHVLEAKNKTSLGDESLLVIPFFCVRRKTRAPLGRARRKAARQTFSVLSAPGFGRATSGSQFYLHSATLLLAQIGHQVT